VDQQLGLVILDNGEVVSALRITIATHKAIERIKVHTPQTLREWIEHYRNKYCKLPINKFRDRIKMLFRLSPFTKHMGWKVEELMEILKETK
jgi:hypothetical protein